ncbi:MULTISPECIES: tetratricopeptide repeat protein [unclassified Streptomyces]|uniref:tetratricopeptide repeat protein n=1 Tax=unclassified Streptomyces TaxID=2593676 RepID=UPI0037030FC6
MSPTDGEEPPRQSVEASGERAVAVGGDIEQVATGDHVTQIRNATVLPPQALALGPLTEPVRYLPRPTALFVGRADELAALDEAMREPGGVAVHAVHGLGGVGKSTLAACWAARRIADLNPVWWITAETAADVGAGLAALSRALQPSLVGVLPEDALRERALQWLAGHDDWLIVLDNVTDPAHIRPLLERAPQGRFLITTRLGATSWRGLARPMDLNVLPLTEAVELFTRVWHGSTEGVEELCAELGCLPLAVDQAAAYCREAGITPREYGALLARHPAALFAAGTEGGEAERTVARVLRVTTARLGRLASMILHVIAWWAPDGIPRSYLAPLGDALEVTEAIRRLAAHSLVTVRDGTLSVHRLVQAVARTPYPEDPDPERAADLVAKHRGLAVTLLEMEAHRLPGEGSEEEFARAMGSADARVFASHVEAFAARSAPQDDTVEAAYLFVDACLWLAANGLSRRAVAMGERALAAALRTAGPDGEVTFTARGLLPNAYAVIDDRERALALAREQLAEAERLFGPHDPETFAARGDLAYVLASVGEYADAVALAGENALLAAEALGPRHPGTAQARQTLTEVRREAARSGRDGSAGPQPQPDPDPDPQPVPDPQPEPEPDGPPGDASGERSIVDEAWDLPERARAAADEGDFERALALSEEVIDLYRRLYGDTAVPTVLLRGEHVYYVFKAEGLDRAKEVIRTLLREVEDAHGDSEFTEMMRQRLQPVLDLGAR